MVLALVAAVAFLALEPPAPRRSGDGGPVCAPKPCTDIGGFELYVRDITIGPGRLTMNVSFTNHTPGGGLEAVSYRHTSPADFAVNVKASRNNNRPVFGAECPQWEEPRIERGASSGADRLCFEGSFANTLSSLELTWTPDTGVFPVTGSVPLGPASSAP